MSQGKADYITDLRKAGYAVLKHLIHIDHAIMLTPAQKMRREADKLEEKEREIDYFERLLGNPPLEPQE